MKVSEHIRELRLQRDDDTWSALHTGVPPMRDTATSNMSDEDAMGPSGTPRRTSVSTSVVSSSSSSDQSSSTLGAI
jgi:hypothetical protein